MKIAKKFEFPDECPLDCPFQGKAVGQGSICTRCPIFSCRLVPSPDERYQDLETPGYFRLIHPDGYREDWAEEWSNWFKNGMKGYPQLFL